MLGIGTVDFDWPHFFAFHTERPGRDVDMMSTPVSELASRVLIPPAEFVVATLLADSQLLEPALATCPSPNALGRRRLRTGHRLDCR